jgi:hypothetical protein
VTGSIGLPAWTANVPKPCNGEAGRGGVSTGTVFKEGDIVRRIEILKGRLTRNL